MRRQKRMWGLIEGSYEQLVEALRQEYTCLFQGSEYAHYSRECGSESIIDIQKSGELGTHRISTTSQKALEYLSNQGFDIKDVSCSLI